MGGNIELLRAMRLRPGGTLQKERPPQPFAPIAVVCMQFQKIGIFLLWADKAAGNGREGDDLALPTQCGKNCAAFCDALAQMLCCLPTLLQIPVVDKRLWDDRPLPVFPASDVLHNLPARKSIQAARREIEFQKWLNLIRFCIHKQLRFLYFEGKQIW